MFTTQPTQVLNLARSRGVIRPRDLEPLGIPRAVIARLVAQGSLVRAGRGLYSSPEHRATPCHPLVEVAARVPGGVINLRSALAFHGVAEAPSAVWLAIGQASQAPRLEVPLELTWTGLRFLEVGVTAHDIEGIAVPVTDLARTVADCFKFRSRVGLDVAIHALRAYLSREPGRDRLWEMAEECRVHNVIRPYVETLEQMS